MRIVNVLLIVLIAAGSIGLVMENLGEPAVMVGNVIGIALWAAPFYFAWRGLGPTSTLSAARRARAVNAVVGVLILGGVFLLLVSSDDYGTVRSFIPIAVVAGVPVLLNVVALGKRKAEIEQPRPQLETTSPPELSSVDSTRTSSMLMPVSTANYFVRHWRGELSLPVSYWVNGALLTTVATIVLVLGTSAIGEAGYSLRAVAFVSLGVLFFGVAAWLWSVVGIWRSADYHVTRGGLAIWANLAKFMVVIGFITMASELSTSLLPMTKEYALIAIGHDPFGKVDVKVSTNGQSVIVVGELGEGSAAEVQKILDATPGATSLILNSNGGRILEAQRLARIVQEKGLDTYVERRCASACTYVFLAGIDRAATPNAKIGFHQPSFPGIDAATQQMITRDMMAVYRAAGLPEGFILRIEQISSDDMWYPTPGELIASNVVTRTSLGGEAATLGTAVQSKSEYLRMLKSIPLYQAYEQRFPGMVERAAERGWSVKQRGGNDAEVMNAMRGVFSETFFQLIRTVDDATLVAYADLFVDELSAAKAVSAEACAKLMEGKLDISSTLPNDVVERELKYTMDALQSTPRAELTPPDPSTVEEAFLAAASSLSEQNISVLADVSAYADQPALVCDAFVALYESIIALPERQRIYALRGMLQSDE